MNALFLDADLLATIATHVPFASIATISQVCKATNGALDWREVVEARIVRFPVGTGIYVAPGNGWYNKTKLIRVVRTQNLRPRLRSRHSQFVRIGSQRRRVRIGRDGVEYANVDAGSADKSRAVHSNLPFCETMRESIDRENRYWHSNL